MVYQFTLSWEFD